MATRIGTKVPLILPTDSTIGKSGQAANARLVNAYAEPSGESGKSTFTIYGAPCLTRWDNGSYSGACRGLIKLSDNQLIGILGNEVVSFDQNGLATLIGSIVGTGRLHLVRNRNAAPQIIMITEAKQVFMLQSGVITQVTDADLPSPESAAYLSGFTVYGIADGRLFASDLEDSDSISAGAFGNAKADDSKLVRVFPDSNYLYVFNEKGTEIWQPNASAPNPDFLFSPIQTNMTISCGATHSVASVPGRGMAWVDGNNQVRLGRDASAERISTHTVERDIAALTLAQRRAVYGFFYSIEGHDYYQIVSPSWTWEHNLTYSSPTKRIWMQRKTYGQSRWLANAYEQFNGLNLVGSNADGKIYAIDANAHKDGDLQSVAEIWCGHSHRFPGAMIIDCLEVDIIAGVGLNSGVETDDNPQMLIDYSDDGGTNFQGERSVPMGRIGERTLKVSTRNWGRVDSKGRIWRFRASANVLKGTMDACLYGRECV